ncbi:MAG: helicase-related protein, partial [Intestinibacter sp.]
IKFTKFDEIVEQINLSDEKWLIFVKSIKDGEKYLKQLRDNTKKQVTFLNRNNITINEEDACKTLNDLIKFEKFEDDVLIATSIIDNGVNVVDRELTNIVSFEYDYIELIQEIEERCIDDYDKFTFIFD